MKAEPIKNRYEFILLVDIKDGNPNGDPDAGNMPRIDSETGMGLITDVCIKRKIRNYVQIVKGCQSPFDIFIKEKAILNNLIDQAHEQEQVSSQKKEGDKTEAARQWMCSQYYDIRTFGAVMTTGKSAGQVRGAVQFTFGRSIDPIVTLEHSITRMAVTTQADSDKQKGDNRTMGRKYTVPYALYRIHGYVSPFLASQTNFDEQDLELLWQSIINMFDHDHSAARGEMNTRALIVFKHSTALGDAPAHQLFDAVTVKSKMEAGDTPTRKYSDYMVEIDKTKIPESIETIIKVM